MENSLYSSSVFINCPFDKSYEPLLRSIIFTVFRCGFVPRSALEEDNSAEIRLDKIIRQIQQCKYGIHDISRTELDAHNNLPRFNMPFELGLFFGAKKFGNRQQNEKNALVFERSKYLYQQYASDLNGVDIKAHENNSQNIIKSVRNWLHTSSGRKTIPAAQLINKQFVAFIKTDFPAILKESHTQLKMLLTMTFVHLW